MSTKYFIDHPMDKVFTLSDPKSGIFCGRIIAYFSNNPNGSVCHARVDLYAQAWNLLGKKMPEIDATKTEGIAGEYGYDKFSAAVWESLHKQGLAGSHEDIKDFTFGDGTFSEESRKIQNDAIKGIKKKGIIPVYSGAGNVREGFEVYFSVVEVI